MGAHENKHSAKVTDSGMVIGRTDRRLSLKRDLKIILVVVAAALLCAGVGLGIRAIVVHNSAQSACGGKTNQSLLKQAVSNLDPTKLTQLAPVVAKIKATKCYDQNANYLYVVTQYYVYLSDSANATKYFDKLQKIYGSNGQLDPKIPGNIHAYSNLKEQVDSLNTGQSNVQTLNQVVPE